MAHDLLENYIYSLDIGTRNVVGMIGKLVEDQYEIIDYEMLPHPERAMYDGQIHDINRVAKIVKRVTSTLEERHDIQLKEVAIAAAGRALKTKDVTVERDIDYSKVIEQDLIDNIEMEGIQKAQDLLDEASNIQTRYYCVGYTTKVYYLDNSIIKSPIDHRGSKLKIELIATFLPHIVVDSLYTVIDKSDLEVINLTLEPIAAINVSIPDNLRMLNLALVDIGAGTSDIALTKAGAIISYGMVAKAGDAITEALVQEYLLDFDEAEKLKIDLSKQEQLKFKDIVGIEHEASREEVLDVLKEEMEDLTTKIADEIIQKNGKKPSAVFLIGGGCQVPGFTELLAKKLSLKEERVAIKGVEDIKEVTFLTEALIGPEFITPVGIGYNGIKEKEKDFLQVTVNGKKIRLFNSKKLSVSHALILVGFHAKKLLAQRGESIHFKVNDEMKTISGHYGESAKIYINGVLSNLDTKIKNRDSIYIEEAQPGKKREMQLKEYFSFNEYFYMNKEKIKKIISIKVNGNLELETYRIKEGDEIEINQIKTIRDLMTFKNLDFNAYNVTRNGHVLSLNDKINHEDVLIMNENLENEEIQIKEQVEGFKPLVNSNENEETTEPENKDKKHFIVNGKPVIVKSSKEMIYVDIFEHIDFDLKTAKGILDLRLNGQRAKYTDILKSGDVIEISWR